MRGRYPCSEEEAIELGGLAMQVYTYIQSSPLDEGSSVVLDAMETKPTFSGVIWRPCCHGAPQWLPPGPTERGIARRHGEITKEG